MNSIADQTIGSLIDELDQLGRQRDDAWQVPRVEGMLLFQIAVSCGAKLIVEIGTSYGFSGLFWGAALKQTGGKLHTIDVNPKKFESAKETFNRAGLSSIVQQHLGEAKNVLPTISGKIDLAFIDADKPSTAAYFDLLWPALRVGGSILTDNIMTHHKELADYVAKVRAVPNAISLDLPVGNGLEWTTKIAG